VTDGKIGTMIAPGTLLVGRYEVERFIGDGAFATVHVARDRNHGNRRVAIKLLRPEHARRPSARMRFERRELALLLRIHEQTAPNVVRALERQVLTHHDLPFLVLEFVDGPTLREVLDERGRLSLEETLRIGMGIAQGLVAIHVAPGVHRDLKPSNIRLRDGKAPVILDLGVAKALWRTRATTDGAPEFMTHRYAAPEQIAGERTTSASDVYTLGLLLYEMLTGDVPLAGATPRETRALRRERDAPKLRLEHAVAGNTGARLVARCLSRKPGVRPKASEIAHTMNTMLLPMYDVSAHRWRAARALLATVFFAFLSFYEVSDSPSPRSPKESGKPAPRCVPHVDECER